MRLSQQHEIQELLNQHHSFSECIIADFDWARFGTEVELTLRYIYDDDGHIYKSMDDWRTLVLRFLLVQELRISNGLTQTMCNRPEQLNWGFSEIALMKLVENSELAEPFRELSMPFHHMSILWETERRIDIVFSEIEIIPKSLSQNPCDIHCNVGACEMEKGFIVHGFLFPTDQDAAKTIHPTVCALYDPTALAILRHALAR